MKISKKDLLSKTLFALIYLVFMLSEGISKRSPLYGFSITLDGLKIKYVLVLIGIMYYSLLLYSKGKKVRAYFAEAKYLFMMILIWTIITVMQQARNGFFVSSYNEIFFLIVPLLYVFLLVNCISVDVGIFVNIAFVIQCIIFFLDIVNQISIANIRAISFFNSYSPFEGEHSFFALCFFLYYLYKNDKNRYIISFVICVLAFKRLAVVSCIAFFIIFFFKRNNLIKEIPKKSVMHILTAIFIIIPVFFSLVLTDEFQLWFYGIFKIDFNMLITGRLERYGLCVNNKMLYGLGSTTEFLKRVMPGTVNRNLHNDLLRIYLECGIVGTVAMSVCYFKMVSKSKTATLLMVYLFLDMLMNHFLGAGRAAFWILIYLTIFCYNNEATAYHCVGEK